MTMDYQKELVSALARNIITLKRVEKSEGATKIAKAISDLLDVLASTIDFEGGPNNHQPGLYDLIKAIDDMSEGLEDHRVTLLEDKKETEEAE